MRLENALEAMPALPETYQRGKTGGWGRFARLFYATYEQLCTKQGAWSDGMGRTDPIADTWWCYYIRLERYGWSCAKSSRQGHRFVMTPARVMYLIRYQGPQWFEPYTYFGNNTLKDIYSYEPVGPTWNDGIKSLLMGVQGSMWTEFCNRTSDVEYMLFPGWRLWLK